MSRPHTLLFVALVIVLLVSIALVLAQTRREPADERSELIELLRREGITDENVLAAMARVERGRFVPEEYRHLAYANRPLPIGFQQTISQPYIVAYMTEMLRLLPTDKVLEIGTGSGYQAAILGELASQVYTIEIVPGLGERARELLAELGYENVHVRIGDGYVGWPEAAPFDAVILTAAPPDQVPQPLIDQLAVGGRLVAPVGEDYQYLVLIERTETGVRTTRDLPVRFVPMTGQAQDD